jgi:hypothetical protein
MVIANTSYTLYTKGTNENKKTRIKKIIWCNRTVGNGVLRIGYTTLGAAFVQVLPDIYMIGGSMTDVMHEEDIPQCGNAIDGFIASTMPVTGSLGDIVAQASVAGAAPNDVQVRIEIEEE